MKYNVVFSMSYEVDAEDAIQAENIAWDRFWAEIGTTFTGYAACLVEKKSSYMQTATEVKQ